MSSRPSSIRLLSDQTIYQNRIFFRTPVAAFFTIIFPLFIFMVFALIFGNEYIPEFGGNLSQYFGPAMAVFAAVSATYTNIASVTAYQRDEGILKRIRGAPLPAAIYHGGKIVSATLVAVIAVLVMMTVGVMFYGIQIYGAMLPAAIVTFLIGVGCFASLGLLVAGLVNSGEAATAVTNATLLPLAFISGVFIPPTGQAPEWLDTVASLFPLKHFVVPFTDAFNPTFVGSPWQWDHLAFMAVWGIVALVIGIRFFKWETTAGGGLKAKRTQKKASAAA